MSLTKKDLITELKVRQSDAVIVEMVKDNPKLINELSPDEVTPRLREYAISRNYMVIDGMKDITDAEWLAMARGMREERLFSSRLQLESTFGLIGGEKFSKEHDKYFKDPHAARGLMLTYSQIMHVDAISAANDRTSLFDWASNDNLRMVAMHRGLFTDVGLGGMSRRMLEVVIKHELKDFNAYVEYVKETGHFIGGQPTFTHEQAQVLLDAALEDVNLFRSFLSVVLQFRFSVSEDDYWYMSKENYERMLSLPHTIESTGHLKELWLQPEGYYAPYDHKVDISDLSEAYEEPKQEESKETKVLQANNKPKKEPDALDIINGALLAIVVVCITLAVLGVV